jgi:hypothetical protein
MQASVRKRPGQPDRNVSANAGLVQDPSHAMEARSAAT